MIDPETDEIFLIDFGLSCIFNKIDNREIRVRDFCGSAEYLAPEAMRGASFIATKTDSWALGVSVSVIMT